MKVQEGDYVDTSGMNEKERQEVVQAFLDAGCPRGEWFCYCNIQWEFIGWLPDAGVFYGDGIEDFSELTRKITLAQLKGDQWSGEGLPPAGAHCEVTWGSRALWEEAVIIPNGFCYYSSTRECWVVNETPYNPAYRPLRTEQEKFTEQFRADTGLGKKAAKKVYDAGYKKDLK